MYSFVAVFVGLTLVAKSNALPIGNGVGNGISLAPVAFNDFYNQEVILANQPIKYAFGFDKSGVFNVGIRFERMLFNKPWAFTAGFSGNPKDLRNTFKFEIGTRILNGLAGLIYGDKEGLKWLSSFWAPVSNNKRGFHAVGLSLEGMNTKPVALGGGVGLSNDVYQGRITLDKDLRPSGSTFMIGSVPMDQLYLNQRH